MKDNNEYEIQEVNTRGLYIKGKLVATECHRCHTLVAVGEAQAHEDWHQTQ